MSDPQVKKPDAVTWAKWPELQDGDDVAKAATPVRLRRLILDAIQAGELRPGARLKETELVAALLVSRTPLREALAALRAEGILERDDDGLRVRRLDWHDVRGLYELRGTLEGLAASLAARNAGDAERTVIDGICAAEAELIEAGAPPHLLARQNRQFHNAILQAAGNSFLAESLERLSRLMVLLGATAYTLAGRAEAIRDEHAAINNAIRSGDATAAATAMSRHLDSALTARLRLLSLTDGQEHD
ncbi:MAG: GntR family transcriptional regulator [Alphaproteobacteria bacterium]|nr:MAG: GntR family transcriptional regulator [Alphaproteobacteria bacterium]